MADKIKTVTEAFALEPKRWHVNKKSKFGIQEIRKEVTTTNAPPDFVKKMLMVRAYDLEGKVLFEWQPDAVNLEYE